MSAEAPPLIGVHRAPQRVLGLGHAVPLHSLGPGRSARLAADKVPEKTAEQLRDEAAASRDAQPAVTRCALCTDWSFTGTVGDGREAAREHRAEVHANLKRSKKRRDNLRGWLNKDDEQKAEAMKAVMERRASAAAFDARGLEETAADESENDLGREPAQVGAASSSSKVGPSAQLTLDCLTEGPRRLGEIADARGITYNLVAVHMHALVKKQLVRKVRPGVYERVDAFREARRVLRSDGVLWLNLGDTHSSAGRGNRHAHTSTLTTPERQERVSPVVDKRRRAAGVKPKDLYGVPFEIALALRNDGWWLRQTVIWDKTQTIPEAVRDRPTTSHEYIFLLSKSARYWYDADAIAEPATWHRWGAQTMRKQIVGKALIAKRNEKVDVPTRETRNARSVWTGNGAQFEGDHAAVMPDWLAERCILAGCPPEGLVLDPFAGACTTALAARKLHRRSIAIELSETSCAVGAERLSQLSLLAKGAA